MAVCIQHECSVSIVVSILTRKEIMKKCCNRLRLRARVGVDENLPTPTPTPAKTTDSGRLRLRLRSPGYKCWPRVSSDKSRIFERQSDVMWDADGTGLAISLFFFSAICRVLTRPPANTHKSIPSSSCAHRIRPPNTQNIHTELKDTISLRISHGTNT